MSSETDEKRLSCETDEKRLSKRLTRRLPGNVVAYFEMTPVTVWQRVSV